MYCSIYLNVRYNFSTLFYVFIGRYEINMIVQVIQLILLIIVVLGTVGVIIMRWKNIRSFEEGIWGKISKTLIYPTLFIAFIILVPLTFVVKKVTKNVNAKFIENFLLLGSLAVFLLAVATIIVNIIQAF